MRLNILFAVTVLVLSGLFSAGLKAETESIAPPPETAPSATTPLEWMTLVSEAGNYTVKMPGLPQEKIELLPDQYKHHFLRYKKNDEVYSVQYFDLYTPLNPVDVKLTLNSVVASFVVGANAKLIEEREIFIHGYPAKEFVFQPISPKKPPGMGQVIIVEQRIYGILVTTPQAENALKFIDSFQFTPRISPENDQLPLGPGIDQNKDELETAPERQFNPR